MMSTRLYHNPKSSQFKSHLYTDDRSCEVNDDDPTSLNGSVSSKGQTTLPFTGPKLLDVH